MTRPALLIPLALALGLQWGLAQTVVYVTPGGTGDGSSWAQAASDLAAEMAGAASGTEIWVAQGTYLPTTCATSPCSAAERKVSFELRDGVEVIGGFVGGETARSQADPSNLTILSGAIDGDPDFADNSFSVVRCLGCGVAGLSNVTVTRGNANGNAEEDRQGGGIFVKGSFGGVSDVTFDEVSVFSNRAGAGGGGGIKLLGGGAGGDLDVRFSGGRVDGNTAIGSGGGVNVSAASFGMIVEGDSDILFVDTEISNNATASLVDTAGGTGGGIYVQADRSSLDLTISRTGIVDNVADATLDGGGENVGGNGGGIYLNGADRTEPVALRIDNSVIAGNSGYAGGGMYVKSSSTFLTNVTVVDNQALGNGGSGGGVYVNGSGSGITTEPTGALAEIVNSIIYDNTTVIANNSEVFRQRNSTINLSYTAIDKANCSGAESFDSGPEFDDQSLLTCGAGMQFNADPLFASGGSRPRLTAASPAIDAGDDAEAIGTADLDGNERIVDGPDGDATVTVDLGAYEFGAPPLPVELISFAARPVEATVAVEWTVGQEIDLAGYRLERSTDGVAFREVIFFPAMGYGAYRYADRAVVAGATYYYRLASVDLDGTTEFSDIVVVTFDGIDGLATVAARLYPNPATDVLAVELAPRPGARTVYASVLDARGRRVALWPLTTDGLHELDLSDLPAGQYVVRLTEGERVQTAKLSVRQ